jgi:hypothetical protein
MTALPPSPFLTESPDPVETEPCVVCGRPDGNRRVRIMGSMYCGLCVFAPTESVETPSRVSTVMEAAAPQTPAGAAADTSDDISDVHEIFHHARKLTAESYRQAEIDRHGLVAVEREITLWKRGAGADYMAPLDVPLFLR